MNLSGANYDLSLDQLLAGVSDDSLHRITCNVLDISNNAMKAAVERIDALETIRDSLNESNNTLIAQRDAHLSVNEGLIKDLTYAEKSIATLRDEYKKLGDILLAERDELESARLDLDRLDEERAHIAALTQARNTLNDDLRAAKATISNLRAELSGLYSEYDKTVKRAHERSRAIGNRLARELKNDPSSQCWLSILGLGYSIDFGIAISNAQTKDDSSRPHKIEAMRLVREATGCGLKEAQKAVEARMEWLDQQKETKED